MKLLAVLTSMLLINITFASSATTKDCVECGLGRSPAVVGTPVVENDNVNTIRVLASVANSGLDSETAVLGCNAVSTDEQSVHVSFFKALQAKKLNFEDVYFNINCESGEADGLMFHYSRSEIASSNFLKILKKYEAQTGKTVILPILNKVLPNFLSHKGPDQTLLDYLTFLKANDSISDGLVRFYEKLIELYRSYGAKYASEISVK